MKQSVIISWSTGKDSAWMLHQLLQNQDIEIKGLCCTINGPAQRVAMHGVNVGLLQKQADALQLHLDIISLPFPCTDEDYQTIMADYLLEIKQRGIEAMAFGDLYLSDVRAYREKLLLDDGIQPLFPLWGVNTTHLAQQLIQNNIKTVVSCIDSKKLSADFLGRTFDESFLNDLPKDIDPCGENGEFHTYVCSTPDFSFGIEVTQAESVNKDGFIFADFTITN